MRKLKLFLAALAMLVGGVNYVNAYTVSNLTDAGWTLVNSITDIDNNLYMFVDANSSNYVMSCDASHYRPCYKTIEDPVNNPSFVWVLEGSNNSFALKSFSTGAYFIQADGWNTSMTGATGSTTFTFTASDGKYSLQANGRNDFVGHWNDNGAAVASDGESIAANKASGNAPGFYVYSISKASFTAALISNRKSGVNNATKASPADVTSYIQNADWSGDWGGWARSGSWGNQQWGQQTLESWNANNVIVKQVISGIPNGLYKLTADVISGNDNKAAYVYAIGDAKVSSEVVSEVASAGNYNTMSSEVAGKTLTADNISVSGNTITVGIDQSTGWIVADNFKLYYYGPTVGGEAIEFTSGSTVNANTWYYFNISATGDYRFTTTDNLNNIIYSQTATTLVEEVENTHPSEVTNLTIGRIYFKASASATLTIEPNSYSYIVGDASASITDGCFIPSFSTITFNFANAASNDPDASFAILNNTEKAALKKEGTTVADGTLSLNGKILTATFENVTLEQSATYYVEIADNVVGYEGQTSNTAIRTSFKTGVIADGVYYFKKSGEYKYLTRGGNYGTETIVDNYGISLQAMIQADGTYFLKNVDHSLSANTDKFLNMYTDQGAYAWTISEATNGYYLKYTDGKYMTTGFINFTDDNGNTNGYNYQSGTEDENEAIVWELLSKEQYAASLVAKKNAEITALANNAGIDGITTLAGLESTLNSNYGETDMTDKISNPLCNSASGWTAVSYNGGSKYTAIDYHAPTIQIWNCVGGITQTIENLPEGLYKVTVSATWRPGNSESATRVGNEANTTAWVYANDYITQLKGWYEGGGTINSTQNLIDNKDNYLNTVYAYVDNSGTLSIGVAVPSFCVQNWCPIYNWTLTYYEAKATAAEKDALAVAISDAEDKTLGFEDGDYAPYNNVAALEALSAAKALDVDAASGEAVVAATTALNSATWTNNNSEVNAIYDGTFANAENNGAPAGWITDNAAGLGGDYHARTFVGDSRLSVFGNESNSAFYQRWDNTNSTFTTVYTYGATNGYTMPLKKAVYRMKGQLGVWSGDNNQKGRDLKIYITDADGNEIASQTVRESSDTPVNSENGTIVDFNFLVTVTSDGNYKFNITNISNGSTAIVLSNLELKKAVAEEVIIKESETYIPEEKFANVTFNRALVEGWNGLVLPFDMTVADVKAKFNVSDVKDFSSITRNNDNSVTLNFTDANEVKAGKPFMVKANAAGTSYTINGVILTDNGLQDIVKVAEGYDNITYTMTGTYGTTDLTNVIFALIQGDKYYYHNTGKSSSAKAFRAYFVNNSTDPSAARVSFNFGDDVTTGISEVNLNDLNSDAIYNLGGQRLMKAKKGLNIQNGKKVVIK